MPADLPVIDKDHNSAEGLAGAPASAGPYRLVEWRQGESLTLEAFPDYFGEAPKTQKVVFRFFTSPAAATNALASGAIDVLADPPRDASLLEGRFEIISGYPGAATMLLRVSTKTAPFDNKTVQQALQHAINRDRIVKEVLYDFGGPALLPFGPNSPAQIPTVPERVAYDLEKSKALLAEVPGLAGGKAMVSGSDPVSLLAMQIIQFDLASIGFDLEIEQAEFGLVQHAARRGRLRRRARPGRRRPAQRPAHRAELAHAHLEQPALAGRIPPRPIRAPCSSSSARSRPRGRRRSTPRSAMC